MKNQITLKLWASLRLFVMIALVLNLFSCSDDDEETTPTIQKTNSITILNEGSFGSQDGTISTFSAEDKTLQTKLYANANGAGIGGLINSVSQVDSRIYAVINSLDKVEIVDVTTFRQVNSITDQMVIPRQTVVIGNKLYVSNWGAYNDLYQNPDSYILVIDLTSNSVTKKIDVPNGAEYLLSIGNELFIAQGQDSIISILDTNSDAIIGTIPVASRPKNMLLDKDSKIWVISGSGALQKINPNTKEVEQTINISIENQYPKGFVRINPTGNKLYFVASESWPSSVSNVYEVDLTVAEPTPNAIIAKDNIHGLGIDPTDGTIYVGIAPDFSSNGVVVRFSSDGTELDNFVGGIAPKLFLFN